MVPDDVLHEVATIGTHDTIVDQLNRRYRGRVDRIEFSIPIGDPDDAAVFRSMLAGLQRNDT